MKAIQFKNQYYKVEEERGDFYYASDNKGKIKAFLKREVEVVEIEALPKAKKYYTKKQVAAPVDPIQSWKNIALSVNNQWNDHSGWQLASDTFGKMDAQGNEFIESLLHEMFGNNRLSEKQAYYLAKFGVETGQLK